MEVVPFSGAFVVSWLNPSTSWSHPWSLNPVDYCSLAVWNWNLGRFTSFSRPPLSDNLPVDLFLTIWNITMVSVCIDTTPASEQSFFWKARWESSPLSTLHSTSLSSIQSCNRHRLSSFLESTISSAAGLSLSLCCSRKAEKINISILRVLSMLTACAVSIERHHMGIPWSQDPVAASVWMFLCVVVLFRFRCVVSVLTLCPFLWLVCFHLFSPASSLLILHSPSGWCSGGLGRQFSLKETLKENFIKRGFFFSPPHDQTEPFHLDCEWLSFSFWKAFALKTQAGVWDVAPPAAISFTWLQARG